MLMRQLSGRVQVFGSDACVCLNGCVVVKLRLFGSCICNRWSSIRLNIGSVSVFDFLRVTELFLVVLCSSFLDTLMHCAGLLLFEGVECSYD